MPLSLLFSITNTLIVGTISLCYFRELTHSLWVRFWILIWTIIAGTRSEITV
jgi:hypothetical protein